MATVYSDGLTLVRAGKKVAPNVLGGKLRVIEWNFASLPAGNIGDVLVCGKIRKGERVLSGTEYHSALTSGGAQATGAYGTYAVNPDGMTLGAAVTTGLYLAAASFEAAGQTGLALTLALGALGEAAADLFICLTNTTEAFATAGNVAGYLVVVGD